MKDTILYFSHDANAFSDTKIINMRADYGVDGYGLYWVIVEQLRCAENYSLPLNKNTYRAIKVLTGTNIDVEKYIKDCINEYDLFKEEDGMFHSCSLDRRMAVKDDKKNKRSEAGKKGAEKRWKGENMSAKNDNATNNDSNAIDFDNKANKKNNKNSKLNEIKLKESKENILTKLNKTFIYIINNKYKELEIEEYELESFIHQIDRLDFKVTPEAVDVIPNVNLLEFKMIYNGLFELFRNGYKAYFYKLTREKVLSKLEKTAKYLKMRLSEDSLADYVAYFYKCLQDEFEKK